MISPNLRKLDLSHKGLTDVPEEIAGMKQLRVLDLSYNNITHIPDFVFALPHLRTLAVGHNQLRFLPFTISGSSIQDLIADYNQIDFILPTTLTGLRTLNISHNRINIGLVSTSFPNLKELDIRHNPSIIIAGPDKLPAISRYYHDAAPGNALVPVGMQYYDSVLKK